MDPRQRHGKEQPEVNFIVDSTVEQLKYIRRWIPTFDPEEIFMVF
jgi:hypothetical protein